MHWKKEIPFSFTHPYRTEFLKKFPALVLLQLRCAIHLSVTLRLRPVGLMGSSPFFHSMGFGKDGRGVILRTNEQQTLLTLADGAVKKISSDIVITEDFRMLKAEILAFIDGLTTQEVHGLYLGIANGELSETEIAEAINADGPTDRNDRLPQERAERAVWLISRFQTDGFTDLFAFVDDDGAPAIWKKRWTFSNGDGWSYFVFNNTGSALTTGANVRLLSTMYGVWLT